MERNLWDVIDFGRKEVMLSTEKETVITAAIMAGQSDSFIEGGKGLIVAGAVCLLFGKLGMYTAKKIAEEYNIED